MKRLEEAVLRVLGNRIALGVTAMICAMLILGALMTSAQAGTGALYTITAHPYANIREGPSKSSMDIGDMRQGDTVRGTYASGWVDATSEILDDGTEITLSVEQGHGWIREDLLTLAGEDYPVGRWYNRTGGRVHIRRAPDGAHTDWLAAGKAVNVKRWIDVEGVAWAYVGIGYVLGDCLEEAGSDGER